MGFSIQEEAYWKSLACEYEAHLVSVAQRSPTAAMLGLRSCVRCGYCCYVYPCIPRPEEISEVAGYLKISVDELVAKYMVADTEDCKIFFLRWAKHGEEDITGGRIPPMRTFDRGYCILFDEQSKTCLIHPARPKEAKYVKCWQKGNGRNKSKWGIKGWGEKDIFKFIPDFNPSKKSCR